MEEVVSRQQEYSWKPPYNIEDLSSSTGTMECSTVDPPVKYTVHRTRSTKVAHLPATRQRIAGSQRRKSPRLVRLILTDADATDSSSDEEDDHCSSNHRYYRVKRYVHEIDIQTYCSPQAEATMSASEAPAFPSSTGEEQSGKTRKASRREMDSTSSGRRIQTCGVPMSGRKFHGVRPRPQGRWATETRDPSRRVRHWLGTYDTTEEATKVYDDTAIQLPGPDAMTNSTVSATEWKAENGNLPTPSPCYLGEEILHPSSSRPPVLRHSASITLLKPIEKDGVGEKLAAPDKGGERFSDILSFSTGGFLDFSGDDELGLFDGFNLEELASFGTEEPLWSPVPSSPWTERFFDKCCSVEFGDFFISDCFLSAPQASV